MSRTEISRRKALSLAAAASLGSVPLLPEFLPVAQGQTPPAYLVLTLSQKDMPLSALATCKDLENSVKALDDEAQRAAAKPQSYGADAFKRATDKRAQLKAEVKKAEKALSDAKIDIAFASANLGLSVVFLGLGCLLVSPMALALVAGATVLTGVSSFAMQAAFKAGASSPSMVLGYARDRSVMFVELGAGEAATAGAKLVKLGAQAAALFIGAYELAKAANTKDESVQMLKAAVKALGEYDAALDQMGQDPVQWGTLYAKHNAAARDALKAYIQATKATDCRFVPPTGPYLRKG